MTANARPLVVAIDMGYGHLRAAQPLADALGQELLHADRPPLGDAADTRRWARALAFHEGVSRLSQLPGVGLPLQLILDGVTAIPPLYPARDLSKPTAGVAALDGFAARGLGSALVERLRASGAPLLTTFYSPAIVADRAGLANVYCVVTDSDINRVWVARDPAASGVRYFAPSPRVVSRLRAYGVRPERIELTGFPLPDELVGGPGQPRLRQHLAARLRRLDPGGAFRAAHGAELDRALPQAPEDRAPPLVTFAVGGAGAQVELVARFLPSLARAIDEGRLRLALVAGVRREVAARLEALVRRAGLAGHPAVEILLEDSWLSYYRRFNSLLARTDALWTKPSEMTFYGALGLPLILAPPVGAHERYNRRWATELGAGLEMRDPRFAGEWIREWLADGTLAAAAWCGFLRMPKEGTAKILAAVPGGSN